MDESKISSLRVMVVDPYSQLREIIRDILVRGIGVGEVVEAKDGEEAISYMRDFPPDVVIADSYMEPINAIEMTKRIRAGDDNLDPHIAVIVISGRAEVGEIMAARDAGANEYLAKPVSAKILELRLHSIFENPRPFVRANNFFGPDRRRHDSENFHGSERRVEEPNQAEDSGHVENPDQVKDSGVATD